MSGNLTDRAYYYVHDKLTGGKLPAGARLSNRAMAKEMGVSLTPVRGAFNRLISEGLLEHHPGLGVFVPNTSRREIEEIYEFRETVECVALAKACGRLSEAVLNEMEALLEEEAALEQQLEQAEDIERNPELIEKWRSNDEAFHLAVLRAAGNRRMLETAGDLRTRAHIVCHTLGSGEPTDSLQRTHSEHQRILDALRQGDAEEAQRVMSEHLRHGCQLALDAHDAQYMQQRRSGRLRPHGPHEVDIGFD